MQIPPSLPPVSSFPPTPTPPPMSNSQAKDIVDNAVTQLTNCNDNVNSINAQITALNSVLVSNVQPALTSQQSNTILEVMTQLRDAVYDFNNGNQESGGKAMQIATTALQACALGWGSP